MLKETKMFKEIRNKRSGDLWARPHPAKFPTYEKELKKNLSSEGNHQQQKADIDVIEEEACPSPRK